MTIPVPTDLFIAPDYTGETFLWRTPQHPRSWPRIVHAQSDVDPAVWSLIVATVPTLTVEV